MSHQVTEALNALRQLGTPDEMWRKSEAAPPLSPLQVNSHIHLPPNFSAFETVQQAVDLAAEQSMGVLGVSNYYDFTVYGEFVERARKVGIFPLFGLEIISMLETLRDQGCKVNDPGNPGKTYICGKGITCFDELTPKGNALLNLIRNNDSQRMRQMVVALESIFAERGLPTGTTEATVRDMIVKRHGSPLETVYIQERHIAQAFQEAIFRLVSNPERIPVLSKALGAKTKATSGTDHVTMQGDIRSHLMKAGKPAFIEESFLNFEEAKQLILELGGIPAYPTLADGTSPVCPFEETPEVLIQNLAQQDIHMAEFIPIRNSPETLIRYTTAMRKAGLAITAGTEHNTLDLIPLNPTCVESAAIPKACAAIFWEGACVVAAHQFLTLHGQPGFVDASGTPNSAYRDNETRIRAFARLGATIIHTFNQSSPSE